MPYIGPWGTFIHIPKSGGTFVRQVLQHIGPRDQNNNLRTHDLPTYWRHQEVWTSVREPCEWLASVWAHRERTAWRRYPHQVPWHYLMDIFADWKSGYWDIWLKQTMSEMPGIVGWFYGMHTPPMVKTYRLGPHLYKKLRDIGGAPDAIGELINTGHNVPEITHEQRILVYKAEQECYTRYGFDPPEGI